MPEQPEHWSGTVCPACGSTALLCSWPSAGVSPQALTRPVECQACGATWTAVYELTGYEGLHVPEEDTHA